MGRGSLLRSLSSVGNSPSMSIDYDESNWTLVYPVGPLMVGVANPTDIKSIIFSFKEEKVTVTRERVL